MLLDAAANQHLGCEILIGIHSTNDVCCIDESQTTSLNIECHQVSPALSDTPLLCRSEDLPLSNSKWATAPEGV